MREDGWLALGFRLLLESIREGGGFLSVTFAEHPLDPVLQLRFIEFA